MRNGELHPAVAGRVHDSLGDQSIPECGHLPQQEKLDAFIAGVTAHTNGAAS